MSRGVDIRRVAPMPQERREKMRKSLARRRALGLPVGRPKKAIMAEGVCEICGESFEYRHYAGQRLRRFCGRRHIEIQPRAVGARRRGPRKDPADRKTASIRVNCTVEQKAELERRARLIGLPASTFLLTVGLRADPKHLR